MIEPELWYQAQLLFDQVIELTPGEREHYIDLHCTDPRIKPLVQALISVHTITLSLDGVPVLDQAADRINQTLEQDQLGCRVGPYRITAFLGRGGMGSVYLAERDDEAYRKQVAVKLLRPDRVNGDHVRRFIAERQVMATLDHPHIARLLDGGTTDQALPFLVMEYIQGETITTYCQHLNLGLQARIELFLKVCDAVHFAHQHLVVHRDLKPGNILVDRSGSPKLLDFGIAKLLDATPALSMHEGEETRPRLLSPQYASPEQIQGRSISTLSDVYSLGVLLYELLSTRQPFDLSGKSIAEIESALDESHPLPASEALHRLSDGNPADHRTPYEPRVLRGDLDSVIHKAMAKKPMSRYDSVLEFKEDIQRFLRGETVRARPTGLIERGIKYARRHVMSSILAAGLVLSLAALGVIGTLQSAQIRLERDTARHQQATAEQITRFLLDVFNEADPNQTPSQDVSLQDVLARGSQRLEQLQGQPELQQRLTETLAQVYQGLGYFHDAHALLEQSLTLARSLYIEDAPELAALLRRRAQLHLSLSRTTHALEDAEQSVAIYRRAGAAYASELAGALHVYGRAIANNGDEILSRPILEEAVTLYRETLGDTDPVLGSTLQSLAQVLGNLGQREQSVELIKQSIDIHRRHHPGDQPLTANGLLALGNAYYRLNRLELGREAALEALAMRTRIYGEAHILVAFVLNLLGLLESDAERPELAADYFERSLVIRRSHFGEGHSAVASATLNLASFYYAYDFPAKAAAHFRAAIESGQQAWRPDHPNMGYFYLSYAYLLNDQRQWNQALDYLYQAQVIYRSAQSGDVSQEQALVLSEIGGALLALGRTAEAQVPLLEAAHFVCDFFSPDDYNYQRLRTRLRESGLLADSSRSQALRRCAV